MSISNNLSEQWGYIKSHILKQILAREQARCACGEWKVPETLDGAVGKRIIAATEAEPPATSYIRINHATNGELIRSKRKHAEKSTARQHSSSS